MIAPIFYEYIANAFHTFLIENDIQFPFLLLLGDYKSHISLELSKFSPEKRILIFSPLPNATNGLQTCDVDVFRLLNASWKASIKHREKKNGNLQIASNINFATIFKIVFDTLIDSIKIKKMFS